MRTTLATAAALLPLLFTPAATPAAAASSKFDLYLDFNGSTGEEPNLASSGSAPVTTGVASAEDGRVVAQDRGRGQAIRLEPFDPEAPADLSVVVVWPDEEQDPFAPRTGSFAFGAVFNIDPRSEGSTVDNGNNLLQRGLYNDDAQYKIQVDHDRVTCRVSGAAGAVSVKAGVDVKPGVWHRVRCIRRGDSVKLVLVELTPDGPVARSWTRRGPTGDLAFSADPPLSVGGKLKSSGDLVKASSDQFNGRVDNVFFRSLDG